MKTSVNVFWFRRDLRLQDNAGLSRALREAHNVLPVFIYDTDILGKLSASLDRRVDFISQALSILNLELKREGSGLLVEKGSPVSVFKKLTEEYDISAVYCNEDYEPYARQRDEEIRTLLSGKGIQFFISKDQCVFGPEEIVKDNKSPYTVFTPYMRKWKLSLVDAALRSAASEKHLDQFHKFDPPSPPSLEELGFSNTSLVFSRPEIKSLCIDHYAKERDLPFSDSTSRLGIHLRFGTISVRALVSEAHRRSDVFLNELIWREFFMMILWHFPRVAREAFRPEYKHIRWRNNEKEFLAWQEGRTGFPLVDAGMRQLNQTGFMHNRVRMLAASFLVKHLLIDWRWGEAYFAEKLDDFEVSSNNGNWQWVAGCGCDAAPYFRMFSPALQQKRFDPDFKYIRKWIPEFGGADYPSPIVDHALARERTLVTYRNSLDVIRRGELF